MSLRLRLTLVAALVVAVVVGAASLLVYFIMRHDLRAQVDDALNTHAALIQHHPEDALPRGPGGFGQFIGDYVQVLFANGTVQNQYGTTDAIVPIDSRIRSVAKTKKTYFLRDVTVLTTTLIFPDTLLVSTGPQLLRRSALSGPIAAPPRALRLESALFRPPA